MTNRKKRSPAGGRGFKKPQTICDGLQGQCSTPPRLLAAIRRMPEVAQALKLVTRARLPGVQELTRARVALDTLMRCAWRQDTGVTVDQWKKYWPALEALMRGLADRRQLAMGKRQSRRVPPHGRGPDGDGGLPMGEAA